MKFYVLSWYDHDEGSMLVHFTSKREACAHAAEVRRNAASFSHRHPWDEYVDVPAVVLLRIVVKDLNLPTVIALLNAVSPWTYPGETQKVRRWAERRVYRRV